jgi:hypothetical protein
MRKALKTVLLLSIFLMAMVVNAQDIKLPAPDKKAVAP